MMHTGLYLFLFLFQWLKTRHRAATFVMALIAFTFFSSLAQAFSCKEVFISERTLPFRDEAKIIDLIQRLDAQLAVRVQEVLKKSETELQKSEELYWILADKAYEWNLQSTLTKDEAEYVRLHVKRGFEVIQKGDAQDLNLYRRNEILDLLYRIEDQISDGYAEALAQREALDRQEDIEILSLALREYNDLTDQLSQSPSRARRPYQLFTSEQVALLLALSSTETAVNDKASNENFKQLKQAGFSTFDASRLGTVLKNKKKKSRCCARGCRTCPKSMGLRSSLQIQINQEPLNP